MKMKILHFLFRLVFPQSRFKPIHNMTYDELLEFIEHA